MSAVKAAGVRVRLDRKPILHGVDLDVAAGAWHAVLGPNGAGKSTLLKAIVGILPYEGDISVGGEAVAKLSAKHRARLIAYVPQQPQLPGDMTVSEYVLLGRTPHLGYLGVESRTDRAVAESALERLDLAGFSGRRLGAMSGGERQRVVLARALAQQAGVLLLDEPTTALDLGHQQQVLDLVDELRATEGLTVISTLHDLSLAAQYADELTLLVEGEVVACGTAREVLTEQRIAEHYGARVRVLDDGEGRPVVHLIREKHRGYGE
ncbi:iron complex transport system ATP-binding protein [Catenulispora sp. EB89]|uniref:ABC transporter ATP-binding protein n=1 Tax=Catenulispora sp. EB89 TaxID=3156257 RepID=UPI00351174BF